MKRDKVLCCRFLFAFLAFDHAQNTIAVYSALRISVTNIFDVCRAS